MDGEQSGAKVNREGPSMNPRKRSRRFELALAIGVTAAVVAPVAVLAAGPFTDVPETHTFAADIQWMADNGISEGCGGGAFCPADAVTRAQMSAFMHRLATLEVVDAATAGLADNSHKLQGKAANQIASQLAAEEDGVTGSVFESNQGLVLVNQVSITVPRSGVLLMSGTSFVDPDATTTDFIMQTRINGVTVGSAGWSAWFRPASDLQSFEMSYTIAEEVTAGTHLVNQFVGPRVGTTDFFHNHETLTVVFVPTDQAEFESSGVSETGTAVPSELGGEAE